VEQEDRRESTLPGRIVAGKYRIERRLGAGGMGYVVAAIHLQLGRRVALKFLHEHRRDPRDVERFLREARAAAVLRSEHVAQVLDVDTDAGEPFIVLEYLEGVDLRELHRREGILRPDRAVSLALQASLGVAEAHDAGIVHRDLKPTNLFATTRADGSTLVKVLDFGISKWRGGPALGASNAAESLTEEGQLVGSPRYMSPEQITSSRSVDVRSDVWSLGVVLYELLTGRLPFAAESHSEWIRKILTETPASPIHVRPDVPLELSVVVMRCLAKDPSLRFADARALAQALRAIIETETQAASGSVTASAVFPTATLDGTMKPQTHAAGVRWARLAIVWAVGTVVMALVAAGVTLFGARRSSPSPAASLGLPSAAPTASASEAASAAPPGTDSALPSSQPAAPSGQPFAPATARAPQRHRTPASSPSRRPAADGEERYYEDRH
jgi:serine/threonine-protein kinase